MSPARPSPWRRRATAWTGALALALSGCPPTASDVYVYFESFEGPLCEGVPCGWSQVAGPSGSVQWSESFAGEHGLHFSGSGVAARVEPRRTLAFATSDVELALDLIARCDPGGLLTVEVAAIDATDGQTRAYEPNITVLGRWTDPRPPTSRLQSDLSMERRITTIDSITIIKSGSGSCEVDAIGIFLASRAL